MEAVSPARASTVASWLAAPDVPSGELGWLDYFVGQWTCYPKPLRGQERPADLRWTLRPEMGGAFFAGVLEALAQLPPDPVRVQDIWGHDPQKGQSYRTFRDVEGSFGTLYTQGWEGERLVFEGEVLRQGERLQMRHQLLKLGPNRFRSLVEVKAPDSEWTLLSEELCVRRA